MLRSLIVVLLHSCFSSTQAQIHSCPLTAIKITPHVYTFRVYQIVCARYSGRDCIENKRSDGWTRSNRMALDLTVKNVGNRAIAAARFEITSLGQGGMDWSTPVNLKPGESTSVYYPADNYSLIEITSWGKKEVSVELWGLRYGDGELVNLSCEVGSAPIPEPFQPVKANPDSPVYEGTTDSPVRVLESYNLAPPKQKMPWEISAQEHRDYAEKLRACNNLRRQTNNPRLDCVPQTTQTHKAVFSLVVGEDGEPRDIRLKSGSLGNGWDEKEIELLQKWNFGPAIKDDKPVAVRIDIPVTYTY